MNVSLKSITIMLFGLLLIAGCGERNEEKDRLAEEGERMRAASVERENSVGKAEQQQLRNEADAGNRAYYSSSTQNFLEGHEYNYFSDGSCTKDCLTKAEAMQACNQVKGYANRLLKSLAITSTSKDKALLEGGDVTNFSATWTGTNCYASLTIKGIYEGSSARTNIGGSVGTFVYSSGEILVYYIDTLG
jgi:hypothetical protein